MATVGMIVIIGYQVYDVARADYGMSVKEAAFQLGILGLVQFFPYFLLTPVAGLVADKFDRRLVAACSLGLDFLIALSLAIVTIRGMHSLPILFSLAALHGMARVFLQPAAGAIAPNIVPAGLIPKAIGLNSIASIKSKSIIL